MKKTIPAQIHALDRVMYMLEEGSFKHLERDDAAFAAVIERLYAQIEQESTQLRAMAM